MTDTTPPPAAAIPATSSAPAPSPSATASSASPPPTSQTAPAAAHPSPLTTLTALTSQGLLKPTVAPAVAACLDLDDNELIVADLVEDIVQRSQDVLFEKHISSQVLPYAIQYAKDTVLKLAMWEFFDEDRVDPENDMWRPDQEPDPLPFDSWARGVLTPLVLPTTASTAAGTAPCAADSANAPAPTLTLHPSLPAHKPIVPWNSVAGSQDLFDALQMDIAPTASTSPSGRAKLTADTPVPASTSPIPFGSSAKTTTAGRVRQDSLILADDDEQPPTRPARSRSKSPARPSASEAPSGLQQHARSPARRLVQQAS